MGVKALPVVSRKDTTKLLGVITMRDVAAALARAASSESD
jgi:CBS domain-containing protein